MYKAQEKTQNEMHRLLHMLCIQFVVLVTDKIHIKTTTL